MMVPLRAWAQRFLFRVNREVTRHVCSGERITKKHLQKHSLFFIKSEITLFHFFSSSKITRHYTCKASKLVVNHKHCILM